MSNEVEKNLLVAIDNIIKGIEKLKDWNVNLEQRVERLEKALTLRSEFIDEIDTRVERLEAFINLEKTKTKTVYLCVNHNSRNCSVCKQYHKAEVPA